METAETRHLSNSITSGPTAQPLGWDGYGNNEYTGVRGTEARPEVGVEEDAAEKGAEEAVDHGVAEPEVLGHTRRVRHIHTGGGRGWKG